MFRTTWIVALVLALPAFYGAEKALADPPLDPGVIKAGLRTAVPQDNGFVDRVVRMANKGKLPPSLVETTFLWAQRKPVRVRFQYFQQALILRAKDIGVTIRPAKPFEAATSTTTSTQTTTPAATTTATATTATQ